MRTNSIKGINNQWEIKSLELCHLGPVKENCFWICVYKSVEGPVHRGGSGMFSMAHPGLSKSMPGSL